MVELNTLKEIAESYSEFEFKSSSIYNFYLSSRKESIKWIKHLKNTPTINDKPNPNICEWSNDNLKAVCAGHTIAFIKHFFNITEDDLK